MGDKNLSIKERLILFLAYLEIGQTKFEEKVGMSRGHIYNMGENLTSKTLSKIKIAYPELNEDWLLTGKGEMIKSVNTQNAKGNNSINSNINNIEGNVTISHNDFSNLLELQKGYQEAQKELNEILKTAQNQLSESQKQVSDLVEILKNK